MYSQLYNAPGLEQVTYSRPNEGPPTGRRLAILSHGHGAAGELWFTNTMLSRLVAMLHERGFCVLAADMGGPAVWGNDTARGALANWWAYAKALLGVKTDKLVGIGWSMGNIAQATWAADNPSQVAALVGLTPVANLKDIRDANRNGYAASINAAYGGAAAFDAARATRDPAARAPELAGLPMKVYRASDDPICTPATVDAYAATTGAATVNLGAVGHNINTVDFADVANFLAPYA